MIAPEALATVWNRAGTYEARFTADELASWPVGRERLLTELRLIRRYDNATTVVCDACHDGHAEEVVCVQSPEGTPVRAYIWCPHAGRVCVPLDRLKQWRVDFDGLAGAVADALELAGNVEEVVSGRVWLLGKATIAGKSRECFLTRGLAWEDARTIFGGCVPLNAAQSALIFSADEVPPTNIWNADAPPVVALKSVVELGETGFSVDRGHLEALLSTGRKKAPATPLVSFPTPADLTWDDVRFVVTDAALRIEAKGKRKDYTFQAAGFEERRKRGTPDRLWALLKTFVMHGGVLPFKVVDEKTRTNLKQYVSDLRQRLAALLPGIEGESISYNKDEIAYATAFRISSEETLQFPTPEGASWTDVSIDRHGDNGIRITVTTREKFSASNYSVDDQGGGGVHRWEAAEREGTIERTYDLRMLRLADDKDKPGRAGKALLAVLSGKGTVKTKAADQGMIELCGVLTRLMGLDESPFEFAKLDEKWVALFNASGESATRR